MQRTDPSSNQIAFLESIPWSLPLAILLLVALCGVVAWVAAMASEMAVGPQAEVLIGWGIVGFLLLFLVFLAWQGSDNLSKWFGRMGVVVDREKGEVELLWGVLFPTVWAKHALKSFSGLVLTREVTEIRSSYSVRKEIKYQVYLVGDDIAPLMVGRHDDYGQLRVMAEQLGQFRKLSLFDKCEWHPEQITPDMFCRPIWERTGAPLAPYEPLASGGGLICRAEPKRLSLEFPPTGHLLYLLACGSGAGLLAGMGVVVIVYEKLFPLDGAQLALAISVFGSVYLWYLTFTSSLPSAITLDVSPSELVIHDRGLFGTRTTTIPSADVWKIDHHESAVSILTSQGQFVLPTSALDPALLPRIRNALLHVLTDR